MATLQKIRNRAGLLVAIIIGLALVAFILGDMIRSGSSLLRPGQLEIADINGESVSYPDFQKKVDELAEIYKMNSGKTQLDDDAWTQVREQAWQNLVRELVMGDVYKDLGITVTPDELFDLVQGKNLHPIIQQLFRNPQTGQVDRSAILRFLKSLETNAKPETKAYWLYIERQIKEDRIQTKYDGMVSQGLYATTAHAKESLADVNHQVDIQYVQIPYSIMPDTAVAVTDNELRSYYDKHQDDYKQEESRTIEYVTFKVEASQADDAATLKWIQGIKQEFSEVKDDKQFVNVNSDVPFANNFQKKEDLPANLTDFAFDGKVGDVYGPFKEDGSYKLVKIDTFKYLPDSVEARHILIKPTTVGSYDKAVALADSLKGLIKKGASFASLAEKYSEDPGSARKGGDLGWFKRNQMVKPFEEVAFNGEVNKVYTTTTQFGVHVIQPTKMGKKVRQVRLATLVRNIEPSTKTYQAVYAQASKFASNNTDYKSFNETIAKDKMDKRIATVGKNDRAVNGLDQSRPLIRAAYTADPKSVLHNNEGSSIFELGDNFVVAALSSAKEKGVAPFEEVKPRVELAVRKLNKGKAIAQKLQADAGSDLQAIAGKYNTEVKSANNLTFNSVSIPSVGVEPAVIGTLAALPEGQQSSPIIGNNGVYVLKVNVVKEGTDADLLAEKKRLDQTLQYRTNYQAFQAHKDAVEVIDKRSKFY